MAANEDQCIQTGWTIPLVKIDGVVERKTLTEKLKTMRSRPVRDDDIFLCTYPKSGAHWTWEILNMIVRGKAEYTKHWKNSASLIHRTEVELEELASPRIIQTHILPRQMPELLWERQCKVVHVQRNPKDCAVSYFCQLSQQVRKDNTSKQVAFTGSWDEFLRIFIAGCVPYGSVFQYVKEWEGVSDVHEGFEVCYVQYEDMIQDCVAQIRRMAEYLERPLPEEKYQEIADACSFKNLKNANEENKDQKFHNRWQDGSSGYFRKEMEELQDMEEESCFVDPRNTVTLIALWVKLATGRTGLLWRRAKNLIDNRNLRGRKILTVDVLSNNVLTMQSVYSTFMR